MSSVTSRIKEIKQPRGGYIKPSFFAATTFDDGVFLADNENVHASIVGMVVDYMTRFLMTEDANKAFEISLRGYSIRVAFLSRSISEEDIERSGILIQNETLSIEEARGFLVVENDGENGAFSLIGKIKGLDDESIIAACKVAAYDIWLRDFDYAMFIESKKREYTLPNEETIRNIRILVQRSLSFWKKTGPIIAEGFTFNEKDDNGNNIGLGGYTRTVDSGDGDYLTDDTVWDFKVSKSAPTNKHTLQLLMYYIMGKHARAKVFDNIKKLGIFNPRLNTMYVINVSDISEDIIRAVENEVICY